MQTSAHIAFGPTYAEVITNEDCDAGRRILAMAEIESEGSRSPFVEPVAQVDLTTAQVLHLLMLARDNAGALIHANACGTVSQSQFLAESRLNADCLRALQRVVK